MSSYDIFQNKWKGGGQNCSAGNACVFDKILDFDKIWGITYLG